MAIDTRDRRMSMIGFHAPVPSVMPNPDGSNWANSDERAMGGLWLYFGISTQTGQPTIRRWGGVPYVRIERGFAGRSW